MASQQDVATAVLERHAAKHSTLDDVSCGLAVGSWSVLSRSPPLNCSELLRIYGVRAQLLCRFEAPHPSTLRKEMETLCRNLRKYVGSTAHLWSFAGPDGENVVVFEEVVGQALLGCLLSYDKTRMSESRWEELWRGAPGEDVRSAT